MDYTKQYGDKFTVTAADIAGADLDTLRVWQGLNRNSWTGLEMKDYHTPRDRARVREFAAQDAALTAAIIERETA